MDGSSTSLVANAPLFTTSGLPMDQHTVTITNSPDNAQAAAFDIDYIQFETQASCDPQSSPLSFDCLTADAGALKLSTTRTRARVSPTCPTTRPGSPTRATFSPAAPRTSPNCRLPRSSTNSKATP